MTQISENSVQLNIFSSEEESGYPGNLNVKVIYKLVDNLLEIVSGGIKRGSFGIN